MPGGQEECFLNFCVLFAKLFAKCLQNVCTLGINVGININRDLSGCRAGGQEENIFFNRAIIWQNVCKMFAHTENQYDMRRVGAGGQEEASPISIICAPLADGASTQNPLVR